ncbi:unnamed protein product [Amaranthus hypochondriacus]
MVHRMDSLQHRPTSFKSCRKIFNIKSEFHDSGDAEFQFLSKRPKFDFSYQNKNDSVEMEETEYNPLEEPSPLGLKLKKSPSFLDLIQMKLSQEKSAALSKSLTRKEKGVGLNNKLKASNVPATLLKIGSWEYQSRYEGDLVAKCYFAKHKLVWEVLDGGLKNKIEIQWSDIMAIKADYPDDELGTLTVVLARQPLFFREINPQPRKHTLWQATTDFTSGQAVLHRQHFLQFPLGTLGKLFQKLIQCDPRLNFLSQQPQIDLDNPYFQPRVSNVGVQSEHEHGFELKTESRFNSSIIRDTVSVSVSGLSSSGSYTKYTETNPRSVPETYAMDGEVSSKFDEMHGLRLLNQIELPGLRPSMSVGDLVNHIGDCISEQMRSDNPHTSVDDNQKSEILEHITHYLLNDTQNLTSSDEKAIMSRVNSLCCLLQKEDTRVQNVHMNSSESLHDLAMDNTREDITPLYETQTADNVPVAGSEIGLGHDQQQHTSMSRKDSVAELLLHLPRIASLPQLLIPLDL